MKAKEFYREITEEFKTNELVRDWYNRYIENTGYENTDTRIADAVIHGQLTLLQAVRLALFIGASEKLGT